MAEMEADKGLRQEFDAAQLVIPRVSILQDLSPQVRERDAEYIKGAKPGLFFNSLAKSLDTMVTLVPSKFLVRYIAWRPRKDGGGLVSQTLTIEEVEENFDPDGIGKWKGLMAPRPGEPAVSVEVIETPEWYGMAKGKDWDWMPVAISFPSTKSKAARWMNSTINMTKAQGKNGTFTPAAFFHQFSFTTAVEQKGDDQWFSFVPVQDGYCMDAQVRGEAKELKLSFERGEVDVASATASDQG
jgi:hypothetical protein